MERRWIPLMWMIALSTLAEGFSSMKHFFVTDQSFKNWHDALSPILTNSHYPCVLQEY